MDDGILVIGYGNAYCHDDGVALYVINELRRLGGVRDLLPDEDGLDELGHKPDTSDGTKPRFLNRGEKRRSVSTLSIPPTSDRGVEWVDSIMLHQLIPEIIPVVANYPLIVFVDAHVGTIPDEVRVVRVEEEHGFHAVSHHMSPGMVLGMVREAKGVAPVSYLVSVRGENFDFGFGISETCRLFADVAIKKILDLADSLPHTEIA
jgi:Ni,Fe-hydrogenase maturation factor